MCPLSCCVYFIEFSEDLIRTRGNSFKLIQHHCHYDLRKFNFTNRVIPILTSLSNHVVSADTINTFKDRLDTFWSNQYVLYDYKADLHVCMYVCMWIYIMQPLQPKQSRGA